MAPGSVHSAIARATGTPAPASALMTRYSRAMSCAVGKTWPSGGRRSAQACVPSVSR